MLNSLLGLAQEKGALHGSGAWSSLVNSPLAEAMACTREDAITGLTRHAGVLQQLYNETEQGGDIKSVVMRMITNEHEVALMLQKLIQGEPDRVVQVVNSMSGLSGQNPGGSRKGIMEFKVIQNLKAVTGDKTGFRQWHQSPPSGSESP